MNRIPDNRRVFPAVFLLATLLLAVGAPQAAAKPHLHLAGDTNVLAMAEDELLSGESAWVSLSGVDLAGTLLSGDAWVAAGGQRPFTFASSARVAQDLRFAVPSAILEGTVDGNACGFSALAFRLAPQAKIGGDLLVSGDDVLCEGAVHGETVVFGRNVTLSGSYGGRVRVQATKELRIAPGTVFGGDLDYVAPRPLVLDKSVRIDGACTRRRVLFPLFERGPDTFRQRLQSAGRAFFGSIFATLLVLWLFPGYLGLATWHIRATPWRTLWTGFAALVAIPLMAGVALLLTGGVSLALLLGGAYFALMYLSRIVFSIWLGGTLLLFLRKKVRAFAAAAIGLFAWHLGTAVPLLSGFLHSATLLLGMGSMVLALFSRGPFPPPPPRPSPPPGA
jgi:hypothetical protein